MTTDPNNIAGCDQRVMRATDLPTLVEQCRFKIGESWTGVEDPALRIIERTLRHGFIPQLTLIHGPPGSGKTTVGRHFGMQVSCRQWRHSSLPCGQCECCCEVLHGSFWLRSGLIEIDASIADIDFALPAAVTDLKRSVKHLWGHSTDNPGHAIVLIDNAEFLPLPIQERLLKPVEQDPYLKLVMTTTQITRIDEGLISRASVYSLRLPTVEQAALHLVKIAERYGVDLNKDLARLMATRAHRVPRDCLATLYRLVGLNRPITKNDINRVIRPGLAEILLDHEGNSGVSRPY